MRRIKNGLSPRGTLIAILSVIFVVLLIFNFNIPLVMDDFAYKFSFATGERLENFGQLTQSLIYHRDTVNGRLFSHFFAMLFLMLPKAVFNFINPLVAVVIALVIYRIICMDCGDKKKALMPFCLALMMIWVLTPAFGEVYLWLDGACNYSWAMCFVLLFLLPFVAHFYKAWGKIHPLGTVFMVAEAFVAGAYSESCSFSGIFMAFCLLCIIVLREKKLPVGLSLSFTSACAGLLFLVLSPSMLAEKRGSISLGAVAGLIKSAVNAVLKIVSLLGVKLVAAGILCALALVVTLFLLRKRRKLVFAILGAGLAAVTAGLLVFTLSEIDFENTSVNIFNLLISDAQTLVVLVSAAFLAVFLLALYNRVEAKPLILAGILFLGALSSIALFMFALYVPARGCYFGITYMSLGIVLLLSALQRKKHTKPIKMFILVFLVLFVFTFIFAAADISALDRQAQEREEAVRLAHETGLSVLELEPYYSSTKYNPIFMCLELSEDPEYWVNVYMAKYFGFDLIIVK